MGENRMKLKVVFDLDLECEHFLQWCRNRAEGKISSSELGDLVDIVFTDKKFDAEGMFTSAQLILNEPVEE
jgi:hypothetical protein